MLKPKLRTKEIIKRNLDGKKDKYQTPKAKHPKTPQNIINRDIHANHCEGQNSAMRRRNFAFRRRTNTYARCKNALQRTLDSYWIFHNFIKKKFLQKRYQQLVLALLKMVLVGQRFSGLK